MLVLYLSSKLDWGSTLALLLKQSPRHLESSLYLYCFFLLKLVFISTDLPYGLALNSVVKCWLVLPVPNWKCQIRCRNGYARLLVFHFTFFLVVLLVNVSLNWVNWFFLILVAGPLFILISCMIFLSSFLSVRFSYFSSSFPVFHWLLSLAWSESHLKKKNFHVFENLLAVFLQENDRGCIFLLCKFCSVDTMPE